MIDSKARYESCLSKNFSFPLSEINDAFDSLKQACEQEPTDLAGEIDN